MTVRVSLPDRYDASPIHPATVRMKANGSEISAQALTEGKASGEFTAKFDRRQVISALVGQNGPIQVAVSGVLNDEAHFYGNGLLNVIH